MIRKIFASFLILTLLLTLLPPKGFTQISKSEEIVSLAKKQLGVPYRFGGSSPSGFDCSGFLYYVFKEAGITIPRTSSDQYNVGDKIKKSDLQIGDLVFFETYRTGPSHSGIYVGDRNFIHASSNHGISISSVDDPHYWSSRYLGARRVVEEPIQMVLGLLPAGEYHDVSADHWAYSQIKWLGEKGIINGYDQSFFLPGEVVTRSQASVIIANALGMNVTNKKSGFKDVPENHWAAGAITAVTEAGYFRGYDDVFKPEEILTREQIAVLFTRVFNFAVNENKKVAFSDVPDTYWAHNAIQRLTSNGIASGYSDHTYRPKNEVTRAEFSVFLFRALHIK